MAGNLLNIGKTGLFAAQAGLATTGHNIANANVAGYSRQQVVQGAAPAQNTGAGFIGSGTEIAEIKRYSDNFLNGQVRAAQAASSALGAYSAQINQVDNLLADTTSGLSPALQDFFKSVQNVSANAGSPASRQSMLSSAETLAARFQGINGKLGEIRDGVNTGIRSNVDTINSYAQQIARLNDQIGSLSQSTGNAPNDLLDARDELVISLNKQVKTTVVAGSNNSLTVSIGSGQPLVVGNQPFQLAAIQSTADPSRMQVGYVSGGKMIPLADSALSGGELGGLLEFRSTTLDPAQNALGRIAIGLASTFNAQQRLGQDSSGKMGADLFVQGSPAISKNLNPNPPDPTKTPSAVSATVSDPGGLTTSDYQVGYDPVKARYTVTRLSDHKVTDIPPPAVAGGTQTHTVDGIDFTVSGDGADGDNFLVRPTINGAYEFSVKAKDIGQIAAAGPIMTGAAASNKGSAVISEGSVDQRFLPGAATFAPVALKFDAASNTLQGFGAYAVTVTDSAGAQTSYAAGAAIPFSAGASYAFGGVTLSFKGKPIDGDTFSVARNSAGVGDNRNMVLLGELQAKPVLGNGTATYQSAFAQLVSAVGNKAREVQINGAASEAMLARASTEQQNVSGVNLDEEAANLLKYQQAYQAAGKVMQIASTLFDTLLSLGR
jgi:flagellar hook-associated protein 1 FlgK